MSAKIFLINLWNKVRSLFNSFPADLKVAVHIGVIITENIKNFIDSPFADVLTAIIPGNIDDKTKELLRESLPGILTNLKLADEYSKTNDTNEIARFAINSLRNLPNNIKNGFLHNLSVLIAQTISEGKLTWSDGVCILEWYYKYQFKKAA